MSIVKIASFGYDLWVVLNDLELDQLINDHPLDAWPTVIQMSSQLISILHRILLVSLGSYSTFKIL